MGTKQKDRLLLLAGLSVGLFLLFELVGGNMVTLHGMKLMANGLCFRHLGCNNGFFGYDALTHFTGGFLEAALLVWLMERFNFLNLFHADGKNAYIKNIIILTGLLAIIGFGWEMIELVYDQVRMNVLHMQLLLPNRLAQPTNNDTMGDIFFGIVGGVASGFLSRFFGSTIFGNDKKE